MLEWSDIYHRLCLRIAGRVTKEQSQTQLSLRLPNCLFENNSLLSIVMPSGRFSSRQVPVSALVSRSSLGENPFPQPSTLPFHC